MCREMEGLKQSLKVGYGVSGTDIHVGWRWERRVNKGYIN